jgi:hypothetical protein
MTDTNQISRENIISAIMQFHTGGNVALKCKVQEEKVQEENGQDSIPSPDLDPDLDLTLAPPKLQKQMSVGAFAPEETIPYQFSFLEDMPDSHFGIIQLIVADTPIYTKNQHVNCMIDISGSMADKCIDGRSQMTIAAHTLQNVINTIAQYDDADVTMSVYGFDNKIDTIFTDTQINSETAPQLRSKIGNLQPRGTTDVFKALITQFDNSLTKCPTIRQTNIMLTDGDANVGIKDPDIMSTKVSPGCENMFIGYGIQHDSQLLQKLADAQPNGSYVYISEMEKGGIAFGELVYQLLYSALADVVIEMSPNAEIYDYSDNTWKQKLFVNRNLVCGATRTFHIRTDFPNEVSAVIYGRSMIHDDIESSVIDACVEELPLLESEDGVLEMINLDQYMLRQKTQELLYRAHQCSLQLLEKTAIKKEIYDFIKFMQQYSIENNLLENEFVTTLIDDLTIVLKTFKSSRAAVYSGHRQRSQGQQLSSNTCQINDEDLGPQRQYAGLQRHNAVDWDALIQPGDPDQDQDQDQDLPEINKYRRAFSSTNATPRMKAVMRCTSSGDQIEDECFDA